MESAPVSYDEKTTIDGGYEKGGCDCKHYYYHIDGRKECKKWRCKKRNKNLENWSQNNQQPREHQDGSFTNDSIIRPSDIKNWKKCILTNKNKPCLPYMKLKNCPKGSWRELHNTKIENCPEDMQELQKICKNVNKKKDNRVKCGDKLCNENDICDLSTNLCLKHSNKKVKYSGDKKNKETDQILKENNKKLTCNNTIEPSNYNNLIDEHGCNLSTGEIYHNNKCQKIIEIITKNTKDASKNKEQTCNKNLEKEIGQISTDLHQISSSVSNMVDNRSENPDLLKHFKDLEQTIKDKDTKKNETIMESIDTPVYSNNNLTTIQPDNIIDQEVTYFPTETIEGSKWKLYIIIGIVIILLLGGIGFYIYRRRRAMAETGEIGIETGV